ncbi:hypothetical protein E4U43_003213, partial [Claviceps pusilla]
DQESRTQAAEFMREVGLKCISFNGVPRTINCLNGFRAGLPKDVVSLLETRPSRMLTPANIDHVSARGQQLWESIYTPLHDKLWEKLGRAHPDLPVHILGCHYGPLLSDPAPAAADRRPSLVRAGGVFTSMVAIACLRAQTGVEPQLVSHILGLKKAAKKGAHVTDEGDGSTESQDAVAWLAGDDGLEWMLTSVDGIVRAMGGPNFAHMQAGGGSRR